MEKYIEEPNQEGEIYPSTTPASAGFFSYKRKGTESDHVLIIRYIYLVIPKVTVKYNQPLPLEQLYKVQIFRKPDLNSTDNNSKSSQEFRNSDI